jgi:hypothetical protein
MLDALGANAYVSGAGAKRDPTEEPIKQSDHAMDALRSAWHVGGDGADEGGAGGNAAVGGGSARRRTRFLSGLSLWTPLPNMRRSLSM